VETPRRVILIRLFTSDSGVYAERESQDLFTVDVTGDNAITKKFPKHAKKGLKADEIIARRSAVPAVSLRKRPGDKTTDGVIPEKRQRTDYVSRKELSRLRKVADGHHDSTVAVQDASYDPWTSQGDAVGAHESSGQFSFLPKAQKPKAPDSMKRKPISLSASGKDVPSVQKPGGGHSYNPVFTDYADRLEEESQKAIETERKRLAAEEAERLKLEAAARSAAEAEAAEARAELSEWDEDSAWEGCESGGEELSVKVKRPQRKTPAQRNKAKRQKEKERRLKHEAAMKLKNDNTHRIRALAKEVAERQQALAIAKMEMSDDSDAGNDEDLRRRKLGKVRLPEKDLELVLPDELQDSLRLLKPEGNLLKDRYRSLLVRGKMESRTRIPFKKQARTKLKEKWTFKDFNLV